jgi:chemotaxis protein MotB
MMKSNFLSIVLLSGILAFASCVSSKKYQAASNELNALKETNTRQGQKINAYEADIKQLKEENISYSKDAEDCRIVKESLKKNLESINKALAEHGTSLRQIYARVDTALLKFYNAGIDVQYKNGLVHISMKDELVFKSGSTNVGWEGKQALAVVADVVNEFPGVSLYVIGNTDDVPYKSGAKDNWSLSTDRANAIVRVMKDEYKVDPARIISGGRAMYHPLADNATAEGKSRNRRTDIIINPNLDRLWEMAGLKN